MVRPHQHLERAAQLGHLVGHQSRNGAAGAARRFLAGNDELEVRVVNGGDKNLEEADMKRFQLCQPRFALLPQAEPRNDAFVQALSRLA